MPWLMISCPVCQISLERYWQPSRPQPIYCSRSCLRVAHHAQRKAQGQPAVFQRYTRTPAMEAALREAAQTYGGLKGLRQTDPRFAQIPYGTIKRWCLILGVRLPRSDYFWTPEAEAACLSLWERGHAPEVIAKRLHAQGFHYSASAILGRMRRLGETRHSAFLSLYTIAQGLAVDEHAVLRWVERGWLRVHHTSGPRRYVSYAALKRFLIAHPAVVAKRRPEVIWLIGILTQPGSGTVRRMRRQHSA